MELHNRISQDVTHIDLLSLSEYLGVFVHHQPTAMGEPETTFGVVRIRNRLRVLVMNAMISNPIKDCVLASNRKAPG